MIPFEKVVAEVFKLPEDDVVDTLGPATSAEWTSVRHLQLIVAVERDYEVSFTRDEVRAIRSVGDLRAVLKGKGVEL